ncbi:MAG TPA: lysylphosphatidylglycerol synthase transmembrane domain-containing protein [bacterium]|nr:lysylphosphatidylglycerol synthase transmembrane domain-containing protein [bacterium]
MLKQKRTWLGIFFIVFTFYFLFRNLNFARLLDNLGHFHIFWILPALAVYLLGYVLRGYRWVILMSPIKRCSFSSLFPTLIIGFMMNNLLPARLGEIYRAYHNGTKEGVSRSASLATILLERLFDGLTMIVALWAALSFARLPIKVQSMPAGIQHAIQWSPWVFGAAFVFCFALLIFKKTAVATMNYFISHAPAQYHEVLTKIGHTFIDGLQVLQNAKESIGVMVLSLLAWGCEFTSYYFIAIGFSLAPSPLNLWSAALLMAVANLGILIPNAPGGIGLFEFIGVALLLPYGIPKETAVGYMFLLHFLLLIPITLMGLYFFSREGLRFKDIGKKEMAP